MKTLFLLGMVLVVAGCDTAGSGPSDGVDLDALFAPPSEAEIDAVRQEWTARDVSAQAVQADDSLTLTAEGTAFDVRILSHAVPAADGSEPIRHTGAVLVPDGAAGPLPVLVYGHGGDSGVQLTGGLSDVQRLLGLMGDLRDRFVYVVPAFRAETVSADGTTYRAEGRASPWDRDVDDTLALLNAALATTDVADADRVAALGYSRGAGVVLLAALRAARFGDPPIRTVIETAGPTDFFGPYVREIVAEALDGNPRNLPGLDVLNRRFIQPLQAGDLGIDAVRRALLRRSPVYFAVDLPRVQIHHGRRDNVVAPSQADRLADALRAQDRDSTTTPALESFRYDAGHLDFFASFAPAPDAFATRVREALRPLAEATRSASNASRPARRAPNRLARP
jgi:acetyl esterase/lipase